MSDSVRSSPWWLRLLPHRLLVGRPTALVISVPEAEPVVALSRQVQPSQIEPGMPAHITVLWPFLGSRRLTPPVLERLSTLCASVAVFDVRLATVAEFPDVSYLAPAEPEPFVELTQKIWAAWPDHPPFGGAYPEIVPHLTLIEGPHDPGVVRAALRDALPVFAVAQGLTLLRRRWNGRWQAQRVFGFAGVA